ncbi:MAG: 2-dehydropantoate 2-reductase [Pyrodictiaceae archaeon]
MANRVAIIGCGSMGLFLASRLVSADAEVVLACKRGGQAQLINSEGIVVEHDGQARARVSAAHIEAMPRYNYDIVLVAVKAFNVVDVAGKANEVLRRDGIAVSIQNGLGAYEELASVVGGERVFYAGIYAGAYRLNDNTVVYAGGRDIYIGPIGKEARNEEYINKAMELASLLRSSGFNAVYVEDAEPWRWDKLAINASINPVTALLGMPNSVIYRNKSARLLAEALALEVATVAKAKNIKLPRDPVNAVIKVAVETGANKSSMLQDIEARRKTEIEYINGAVVREAERHSIYVPFNQAMLLLIKALEEALGIE